MQITVNGLNIFQRGKKVMRIIQDKSLNIDTTQFLTGMGWSIRIHLSAQGQESAAVVPKGIHIEVEMQFAG
jgi:hypothetical protein